MNDFDHSGQLHPYFLEHSETLFAQVLEYNEVMTRYQAATQEITTKLEILRSDFNIHKIRNPIDSIQSRIKRPDSIVRKLRARGLPIDLETIREKLNDIAGVRVICPFIDDIYLVADLLANQTDIRVIHTKDYIKEPKANGYRSYHMVIEVPVFFSDAMESMRVEVQLRTVAMDFWASLEHEMKYKKELPDEAQVVKELRECAETIARTDLKMLELRKRIEGK